MTVGSRSGPPRIRDLASSTEATEFTDEGVRRTVDCKSRIVTEMVDGSVDAVCENCGRPVADPLPRRRE